MHEPTQSTEPTDATEPDTARDRGTGNVILLICFAAVVGAGIWLVSGSIVTASSTTV